MSYLFFLLSIFLLHSPPTSLSLSYLSLYLPLFYHDSSFLSRSSTFSPFSSVFSLSLSSMICLLLLSLPLQSSFPLFVPLLFFLSLFLLCFRHFSLSLSISSLSFFLYSSDFPLLRFIISRVFCLFCYFPFLSPCHIFLIPFHLNLLCFAFVSPSFALPSSFFRFILSLSLISVLFSALSPCLLQPFLLYHFPLISPISSLYQSFMGSFLFYLFILILTLSSFPPIAIAPVSISTSLIYCFLFYFLLNSCTDFFISSSLSRLSLLFFLFPHALFFITCFSTYPLPFTPLHLPLSFPLSVPLLSLSLFHSLAFIDVTV